MTGFWIFMLICELLIPFTMIIFGILYSKKAPKKINYVSGYRTVRSMKNKDTWMFAHHYVGKLWKIIGIVITPLTFVAMLFLYDRSVDCIGICGTIISGVQLVIVIGSIFPVEAALKRTFDENGQRKL